ncbi:hypothetical protein SAMN02745885_01634 [Carboxydocella sporoproducens DSM 16521]|uniref:CcmD family protein n=2 Tax=Carboxydocella TaxID=178898 RepID=A0A1T4QEG3_9FIRM|nr:MULTISPECIES: hypothetical protein [Carboxydocella]AVX21617.1 hypothetical protein CFE_2474 [Carboxydocella thermautotrophica]SKA02095.1 hypothetical protein SAMN02745885_01634 [Carboxydocella sporoproducens DSM 16521]
MTKGLLAAYIAGLVVLALPVIAMELQIRRLRRIYDELRERGL